MSKQVNYNENLCSGAAIRDDKGRRISKLFEASHPKMTVGYAKNLIMPDDPTEQEFNFRQSGGGVIEDGVAVIDKVKGNSVVWNQAATWRTASQTVGGVTATYDEQSVVLNGTATENAEFYNAFRATIFAGHKYVGVCTPVSGVTLSVTGLGKMPFAVLNSTDRTGDIGYFSVASGTVLNNERIHVSLFDLTQMFGAGNEPTTYEEFLQRKPKVADEYAYNEGTIVDNKVEKVVTTGRNLWDEQWELGAISSSTGANAPSSSDIRSKNYIPVMPGTTYYSKCPQSSLNVRYYDANKNFLAAFNTTIVNAFAVPSGAHYLRFWVAGTTYNHDICINLSDPAINGQYFPYEKHELDLSWVKEIKDSEGVKLFEDGMRSAGTAFDEVGKNKAVKRLGSVDLGSLDWIKYTEANHELFQTKGLAGLILPSNSKKTANVTCNKYNALSVNNLYSHNGDGIGVNEIGTINIYDKALIGKTAEDFKTAMQGVLLYYELAEPIEVEYDEKSLTYPVVAGGTEEAIASEPSSAFRADIGYGIDAVKLILNLKARVEALEGK